MLASPPCFFLLCCWTYSSSYFLHGGLPKASYSRLPPKGRATHSPRYMVIPGFFLPCSTEEAPRLPGAGTCKMPLIAASPAAPAAVRPSAFRRYMAKAKAAEVPVHLLFPANSAGDPLDLDVGPLKQLQRPCFLQKHIRLPVSSIGCLT